MEILWTVLIGFVVGALAKLVFPGKDPGGCILTTVLGVAGALVAGFLGRQLGWYEMDEGPGFLGAFIGAVIILAIYRAIFGRRRR
ncbi:MAG TPA: GlsB/YeaQ/YmgE family stress response membrane protein [Planctomycetota bacterium]|nr:GlsB/YeaQ/YmgE family stress response membrane protein [Planctomycetota bacterium]